MTREFQATYRLPTGRCEREIDRLLAAKGDFAHIEDQSARLKLLTQALITPSKTHAQSSDRRNNPSGLRKAIRDGELNRYFEAQRDTWLKALCIWPERAPSLDGLPPYSFVIRFGFRLRRPYLSQDDTDWYIIGNAVRKDRVFQLPYVAPTSWKGALRSAMRLQKGYMSLEEEQDDQQMMQLFGNVKSEEREKEFRSGRLQFFPTFFHQISLEVINPHDRETGAGTLPIYIESVPAGAQGIFTLLYVPFDTIGEPEDEVRPEVADDLKAVVEAVEAMFTIYGFGAKTSSGFGVAEDSFPPPEGEKYGGLILVEGVDEYYVGGFEELRQAVRKLRERMLSSQDDEPAKEEKP